MYQPGKGHLAFELGTYRSGHVHSKVGLEHKNYAHILGNWYDKDL